MGGAGMGPISPIEMMAERVRRREVGREAHGEQPRRQGPAPRPPVELFSGPVGSGLTPGFGPGKHYQTPPAFAEQADPGPSGYDTPGFVSPEYDDYDEDEEISITEMAVMDNAARHGLRPEEAVVQQIDGVTAEEMRDQAMQQFIKRQGRLQTGGGIVTDPFAPMGMRGRPAPPPEPRGGPSGRLNTRRANQGRPAVGAIARLQERRRQEEEARRLEEEAALELEGAYNPTDTFDDDLAGGGITALADSSGTGPETFDAYEELDEPEPEPEPEPAEEYGGGAIGRLLAGRARAARDKGDTTSGGKLFGGQVRPVVPAKQDGAKQDGAEQDGADGNGNDGFEVAEVTGEPDDREESEAWSGGAPGRLHARERMHARGATGGEAEEDAPSSHLEQLMARASEGEPMPPASTRRSRDRKPVPKGRRRALAPQAGVEQPAKRASLRKAAATTKGARKVATVNKAAGAGTTTTKGGKATSEKGASGRVAEKAAMDKTPTARRARAIKATAKKASSAKKTGRTSR